MEVLLDGGDGARAFLEGEPSVLAHVSLLVERVVRTFHAPDSDTPKDLVQEIMSRLCANLRGGRFRGAASLDTYAQSVARYTCIEILRRRRCELHLEVEHLASSASWSGPEEWLLRREEFESHLRAFSTLAPDCQELLRLVFGDGLSYRELAERLGISEGALKSRIHRCRLALRVAAGPARQGDRPSGELTSTPHHRGESV